jgi:hypothetical protein
MSGHADNQFGTSRYEPGSFPEPAHADALISELYRLLAACAGAMVLPRLVDVPDRPLPAGQLRLDPGRDHLGRTATRVIGVVPRRAQAPVRLDNGSGRC